MNVLMKTLACAAMLTVGSAHADVIMLTDTTYTGDAPGGAGPWITTTFTQTAPDNVRLTIQNNLSTGEFVSRFFFNMEPFSDISASFNSGLSVGAFGAPVIATGKDQFMAASGGLYDFRLQFPVAPPAMRFNQSDVAVIDLSGPGLSPQFFAAMSKPGGPGLSFYTAAHIQGIGSGEKGSGWSSSVEVVPLPPGVFLGLAGLALVAGLRVVQQRR